MTDIALGALREAISTAAGPILWVLDAEVATADLAAVGSPRQISVLTNRVDQAQAARECGFEVRFSDYDFTDMAPGQWAKIAYRIGKDKALVHHVINAAWRCLAPDGGTLVLAGRNDEGFATYRKKAALYLAGASRLRHLGGGAGFVAIRRAAVPGAALEDRHYARFTTITDAEGQTLVSKPGIFGWNKIDTGSTLLLTALREQLPHWHRPPKSVLDLGCGYGYLAVNAALATGAETVATDHNLAAVNACRRNFERYDIPGEVVADDCAAGIERRFDVVLCNPPFHRGFQVSGTLVDRFVSAAARCLADGGHALFVVNQFIGLERAAADYFRGCRMLAHTAGFRVFALNGRR